MNVPLFRSRRQIASPAGGESPGRRSGFVRRKLQLRRTNLSEFPADSLPQLPFSPIPPTGCRTSSFRVRRNSLRRPRDIPPGRVASRAYRSRLHPSLIPTCLLIPPPPLLPPVWAGRGLQRTTLLLHTMQRLLILCTSAVSAAVSSDRCVLGVGMGAQTPRHVCRAVRVTEISHVILPKPGFGSPRCVFRHPASLQFW